MPFRRIRLGSLDLLLVVPDGSLPARLWRRLAGSRSGEDASATATISRPSTGSTPDPDLDALAQRVAAIDWYHTIDLGNGIVTPGAFDHRPYLSQYRLPERLDGMRVLDVATFDGFWAFEFERRGAAEVVAIDIDSYGELDLAPAIRRTATPEQLQRRVGKGFALAREVLGAQVRRERLSVYELSPERLGTFDMVFIGSLLLHLRDPIGALQKVSEVTAGYAHIVECFHPTVPDGFAHYEGGVHKNVWWSFGLECLEAMVRDAGFSEVETLGTFGLEERGDALPRWHAVFKAFR